MRGIHMAQKSVNRMVKCKPQYAVHVFIKFRKNCSKLRTCIRIGNNTHSWLIPTLTGLNPNISVTAKVFSVYWILGSLFSLNFFF